MTSDNLAKARKELDDKLATLPILTQKGKRYQAAIIGAKYNVAVGDLLASLG